MIRPIMKSTLILSRPSAPATAQDASVAQDLLDTFAANRRGCAGMAANMIGILKRIIVVDCEGEALLMYNPVIESSSNPYETEEGCLSLEGLRPATRYRNITVLYEDENFSPRKRSFSGYTAQIIQHEIDHCDGSSFNARGIATRPDQARPGIYDVASGA